MHWDKLLKALFTLTPDNDDEKSILRFVRRRQGWRMIKQIRVINPEAKRTFIFLTGWHERNKPSYFLRRKIVAQGDSYLFYQLAPGRLSSKPKLSIKAFELIKDQIVADIEILEKKTKKILIGNSLGATSAVMIANKSDRIDNVILVVPGKSTADSIWTGIRTQVLKQMMKRRGITLAKLKRMWQDIEPVNNLSGLVNKKVIIYNSKHDLIVPYNSSLQLIATMKKQGIKPKVYTNKKLGHYLSIVQFYFSKKTLQRISK